MRRPTLLHNSNFCQNSPFSAYLASSEVVYQLAAGLWQQEMLKRTRTQTERWLMAGVCIFVAQQIKLKVFQNLWNPLLCCFSSIMPVCMCVSMLLIYVCLCSGLLNLLCISGGLSVNQSCFLKISSPPTKNRNNIFCYLSEFDWWKFIFLLVFCTVKSRHLSWYWYYLTMISPRQTHSPAQTPFNCCVLLLDIVGSWIYGGSLPPLHPVTQLLQADANFRDVSQTLSSFHESLLLSYLFSEEIFPFLYELSQCGCWLWRNFLFFVSFKHKLVESDITEGNGLVSTSACDK